MRCKVEGQHRLGAARGVYEIMERQSTMAEEVVRLVKPDETAENKRPLQPTGSNQLRVGPAELPPCLRTAWQRGQKERKPLLDGGKGKKTVSFHESVIVAEGKRSGISKHKHSHPRLSQPSTKAQTNVLGPVHSRSLTTKRTHAGDTTITSIPVASGATLTSPSATAGVSTMSRSSLEAREYSDFHADDHASPDAEMQETTGGSPPKYQNLWAASHRPLHGLNAPTLNSGKPVTGDGIKKHRVENKRKQIEKQAAQHPSTYWTKYEGAATIPEQLPNPTKWRNIMCPQNLALYHPAAATLLQYATGGCPVESGRPWSKQQMAAAVTRGPHSGPFWTSPFLSDSKMAVLSRQ